MPDISVHSTANEAVSVENLNFSSEVAAKGGDRAPAENDSHDHQSQSANADEPFCGWYVSQMSKTHRKADQGDQMADIPQSRRALVRIIDWFVVSERRASEFRNPP